MMFGILATVAICFGVALVAVWLEDMPRRMERKRFMAGLAREVRLHPAVERDWLAD